MHHLRLVVVDLADAMAAVLAHHAEALGLGIALDRVADVAQRRARLDRADAAPHGFVGGIDQALGHDRRRADVVHAAGITVPAILDHGDIDVDDVAVLEDLGVTGDAVADHVVDRRADRLGEAAVADIGRRRLLHVDDVVVADAVQLFGRHARLDVGSDDVEHLAGQTAGDAHQFDFLGGFQIHAHGAHYRRSGANLNGIAWNADSRGLGGRTSQVHE